MNVPMPKKKFIPPATSFADRRERMEFKTKTTLAFIADEKYSTANIISGLLECSVDVAMAQLKRMEREGLLDSAKKTVHGRRIHIFAATTVGLKKAVRGDVKRKSPQSFHENYLFHHLQLQALRVIAELHGHSWQSGDSFSRKIYADKTLSASVKKERIRKIPDAILTIKYQGISTRYAIEAENHIKSKSRLASAVANHVEQIKLSAYDRVFYLCSPDKLAEMREALNKVPQIANRINLNIWHDKYHADRFWVLSYPDFAGKGASEAKRKFLLIYSPK